MRIVTWNIQWGRGADGGCDLSRTLDWLRAQEQVDVICLQEVAVDMPGLPGGGADGAVLSRLAAALPGFSLHYLACVDVLSPKGGRSRFGNAVLSRLPVLAVRPLLLPRPADPGVPGMQRGCLEIVVRAPTRSLRVQTTHLEYYSAIQRRAQVERLRDLHREACLLDAAGGGDDEANPAFRLPPPPAACVLCGDFNFPPGTDDYRALIAPIDGATALVDAWSGRNPGQPHEPTVGLHGAEWPDHAYCCDFFFVSAELAKTVRELRVDALTPASDHQPVLLELDV